MKKLAILFLLSISISMMAQRNRSMDDAVYQSNRLKPEPEKVSTKSQNLSAGDYLKKAANQRFASTLTGIDSGFMLSVSPTLDDNGSSGMVAFGGVVLGIASIITHFMGISSEYKAGVQLNKERSNGNQAYIQPAKEGIGLNITF